MAQPALFWATEVCSAFNRGSTAIIAQDCREVDGLGEGIDADAIR
jgi:hypothetical protein